MVFHIDEEWIRSYPVRKKQRRIRSISTITTMLVVGLFVDSLAFWVVGGAVALYYAVNLMMEPSEGRINAMFEAMTLEVKEDGLHQGSLKVSDFGKLENDSFFKVTPWSEISFKKATTENNQVKKIVLVDQTLPFGAQTVTLQNYENMNELHSKIKSQLTDVD
ncbi:MAG: hypothetical protein OQK12_10685 [Motiliproteus sp.]|nr:hypothetical protein [Motiliproteus sp.]MCW9054242.1 hypothetical protein [Motiliproteus sp.]